MSATLMCLFLIVSFKFDDNGVYWFWENQIQVVIVLGISATVFGVFWMVEQRKLLKK